MLIRKADLDRIRSGEISLAFRRWKRPTVKQGGPLRTAIGVLRIESLNAIGVRNIADSDARRAGYSDRADLLDELRGREGTLYRIQLRYDCVDPRIELREKGNVSEAERSAIRDRLDRMDAASRKGPWTRKVLKAVRRYPMLPAAQLAARTGSRRSG